MLSAATRTTSTFAWQGWMLRVPAGWNPVRLEGDHARGQALLADLARPRLGIRWSTPRAKGFDAEAWARRALVDEVGELAAGAARPMEMGAGGWQAAMCFVEPDPPGRDVWAAYSPTSRRAIQVVCPVQARDAALVDVVLPTLADQGDAGPVAWHVFDLRTRVPAGFRLRAQQLNAGDLRLSFARVGGGATERVSVRQIALAKLALKRMPLEKWLAREEALEAKHFRPADAADASAGAARVVAGAREVPALSRRLVRRRRFAWLPSLPRELFTFAVHDDHSDRLLLVQATDRQLAATTVAESLSADAADEEGAP